MNTNNRPERYNGATIAMHWLMLLLLAAVYACIELRGYWPRGSDVREGLKTWHFMLGLGVFVLVFMRLALRWTAPSPAPHGAAWQRLLAQLGHGLLYLFMIAMPLLGWLALSAAGKPIPFFGLDLPALTGPDKDFAHSVEEIHETIGTIGYYLIGLHAAAALFHHYVLRDDTMLRMLPRRRG
ncbi:cytochrome b [Dokdonella sp.]|uniref:cytochrome b n=1 Tax=Dokdonella sp. TaxID=2291710 RepID=UPI003784ECBB